MGFTGFFHSEISGVISPYLYNCFIGAHLVVIKWMIPDSWRKKNSSFDWVGAATVAVIGVIIHLLSTMDIPGPFLQHQTWWKVEGNIPPLSRLKNNQVSNVANFVPFMFFHHFLGEGQGDLITMLVLESYKSDFWCEMIRRGQMTWDDTTCSTWNERIIFKTTLEAVVTPDVITFSFLTWRGSGGQVRQVWATSHGRTMNFTEPTRWIRFQYTG